MLGLIFIIKTFGLVFTTTKGGPGYDTTNLPYLTQWKNTRQGIYVSGVEPSNCIPEGRNAARENKRLMMLKPGEARSFSCRLEILADKEAVEEQKVHIDKLQSRGAAVVGCELGDFAFNEED